MRICGLERIIAPKEIYVAIYTIYLSINIVFAGRKILKSLPMESSSIQCVSHKNFIYIMGGKTNTNDNIQCLKYDTNTDDYIKLKSYPSIPKNHSITKYVNDNNKLFILSLANTNKVESVSDFLVYDAFNDKWLRNYESRSSFLCINRIKIWITCIDNKYLLIISGDRYKFVSWGMVHDKCNFGIFDIEAINLSPTVQLENSNKRKWIKNLMRKQNHPQQPLETMNLQINIKHIFIYQIVTKY